MKSDLQIAEREAVYVTYMSSSIPPCCTSSFIGCESRSKSQPVSGGKKWIPSSIGKGKTIFTFAYNRSSIQILHQISKIRKTSHIIMNQIQDCIILNHHRFPYTFNSINGKRFTNTFIYHK